jgi:hypothetical protein
MRNTNKWVLTLLLVVFAAGCGSDNGNTSSNEITAYSLSGTDAVVHDGVVTEGVTPKTIDVVMPFGTDLSQPLIATFTTTGASVMIGEAVQESEVTENVFLLDPQAPMIYTVTALDGTTANYEVNVTEAANDAAVMTTFFIDGNEGVINETAVPKTIDVVMPYGTTDLTLLTATFVATGDVTINEVAQVSGDKNDFSGLVTYTVTAADGIAAPTYEVNVTVAASDAAVMTTFSIDGNEGIIDQTLNPKTIDVEMPFGTNDLTALVATYTTSPDATVMIVDAQTSAQTQNDFTNQVTYTVTAADGVTTANYDVFVTVATGDAAVMTSFSIDGNAGIIDETLTPKTIDVLMNFETTDLTALVATYATSPGASVKIVDAQTSAQTQNDFTNQVTYTVTAADGVTTANYDVLVSVAQEGNPTAPDLGEAGRFVILASQTITTTGAAVISDGDMANMDQARSYLTTGGFTPGTNPGEFTQLTGGLSYSPDDSNTIATAPYSTPFPTPVKTATVEIGSEWATTGAMITQAKTDLTTAYNTLARTNLTAPTTTLASAQLGGQTLTAGVYYSAANVLITETPLVLDALDDADAVWIFNIDGTLTAGAPTGGIEFVDKGQAKNVYWRTGGDTVIKGKTTFIGSVFSHTQVRVLEDANVTGSLFALTEQVTTGDATITKAPTPAP